MSGGRPVPRCGNSNGSVSISMATAAPNVGRIYERRFAGRVHVRNEIWRVLVEDYFQQMIPRDGVVLDLGAGYGEFLRNVNARRKLAVDANRSATKFWPPDFEPLHFDVTEAWPVPRDSVDVVFTSNFFEHLLDKRALDRCLDGIESVLKPGGKLIAIGPNIRLVGAAYWDFYDHYLPLSEKSLREALEIKSFQVAVSRAAFLPYRMSDFPDWTANILTVALRCYLRLPMLWWVSGKQFLIVAEKIAPDAAAPPRSSREW